jgi:hypothetical protein
MAAGSRLTSRVLTGGSAPRTCLPATAAGTARLAWVDGIGTPIQKSASVAADVTERLRGGRSSKSHGLMSTRCRHGDTGNVGPGESRSRHGKFPAPQLRLRRT